MKNPGTRRRTSARANSPEWADGLRKLYDSVVEEPLPDSFAQLLDKLDGDAHG
ncbi:MULTISPECIES: NepR family anti-sigma factor [unclassified Novosphingobium]|nr:MULTISPECIES: NepR family anti-sigma factor [Novosphingobium]